MKGSNKLNSGFQKQHWENSYGPIPDDWDFVTIGSLFQERREQSADKHTYPLYSFTIEDGVTPKTDRYERGFLLKDPENNQFLVVHPGDFVFNPMNLRFGAISYSKVRFPVLVSAYYNVLKPKLNKCDPDFMEAFLRSHEIMNLYDRIAIGSLIEKRRVHLSILNQTFIAIPPLKEQTVIGEKLKTWDRAIVQTSKLIEAKRKIKKGLMQQLFTGKRRFPGFNNSWKKARLEEVCKIIYGKSQNAIVSEDGPYPIWGTGGIVGYAEEYLYDKPSVILGRKGTIDRPYMSAKPFWAIDTTFYTEIKDGINPQWLYQRFLFIPWRKFNEASGVPSLSRETVYKIRIDVPDTEEQRKIAAVLDEADRQIESLVRLSRNFEEQKHGLMQKLLTGQIRVKTTEEITA